MILKKCSIELRNHGEQNKKHCISWLDHRHGRYSGRGLHRNFDYRDSYRIQNIQQAGVAL